MVATVALITVAGLDGWQPNGLPRQNQKRLSLCLMSRHPSVFGSILSMMPMSQPGPRQTPEPLTSDVKWTQALAVKSPADT